MVSFILKKVYVVTLCVLAFCVVLNMNIGLLHAREKGGALDERILECADVFEEIMDMPDSAIPQDLLSKCYGIAIFPSVLKGGFIVGARYGKGIILYHDRKSNRWSAPAFFTIKGLSYGLQVGGQAIDLILIITNDRGMKSFLDNSITLGGDLAVAAGPVGRDVEASTDLKLKAGILSYSRSKGLFAGISLKGAVIKQDQKSNESYYGNDITAEEILFEAKVNPTLSGKKLIRVLESY